MMKKVLVFDMCLILVFLIVWCTLGMVIFDKDSSKKVINQRVEEISKEDKKEVSTESMREISDKNVYEYIDDETGVHYLVFSSDFGGGVTPRLNSDGTIMVDEVQQPVAK